VRCDHRLTMCIVGVLLDPGTRLLSTGLFYLVNSASFLCSLCGRCTLEAAGYK